MSGDAMTTASGNHEQSGAGSEQTLDECLLCSSKKRDILFLPCAHVCVCNSCSDRVKKCLLCKEYVDDRKKVLLLSLLSKLSLRLHKIFRMHNTLIQNWSNVFLIQIFQILIGILNMDRVVKYHVLGKYFGLYQCAGADQC